MSIRQITLQVDTDALMSRIANLPSNSNERMEFNHALMSSLIPGHAERELRNATALAVWGIEIVDSQEDLD